MRTELLAPAGSIEALKAALIEGADAIYIGGSRFGARAYASNPDQDQLLEAIDLTHRLGRKLYMTVNTLTKDREIEKELYDWMKPYVLRGLDGVIVQDLGIIDLFQRVFPDLPLHASTQMCVTGPNGTQLLKEAGLERVVPAREISLEEIRQIHEETGVEIEAFAHGAMCYSYSGQCLMSSLIGGRSGNRGRCAGVCRLPFDVAENGSSLTGRDTRYPLNMKDMCTIDILPQMIEAGIMSFKIEGRMKKPEYTAGVVKIYRKYLDLAMKDPDHYRVTDADRKYLWDLFNRDGFNPGCYLERNGRDLIALKNEKLSDIRQKTAQELTEQIRNELAARESTSKLQAPIRGRLKLAVGSPAALTLCWEDPSGSGNKAEVSLTGELVQQAQKQPMSLERVEAQMNKTGGSSFCWEKLDVELDGAIFMPVQQLNELRRQAFAELELAIQKLFAREEVADAETKMQFSEMKGWDALQAEDNDEQELPIWISVLTREQFLAASDKRAAGYYLPWEFFANEKERTQTERMLADSGKAARMVLPYSLRKNGVGKIKEAIGQYLAYVAALSEDHRAETGILARNMEEIGILAAMKLEEKTILDSTLYTMNTRAETFWSGLGFSRNTMSLELNQAEMKSRANHASEMVLYGRAPMMISAHCLKKTMDKCTHSNARMTLTDRKNAKFPVFCNCDTCYNVIYNSLPTSLYQEDQAIGKLGFCSARLEFTDESPRETAQIADTFLRNWRPGGDTSEGLGKETTKGHFRRGVE